MYNIIINIL